MNDLLRARGGDVLHLFVWMQILKGIQQVTSFCAFQLANTEEYIDGGCTGNLGEVLVRCNNVLYIRGVEEDDEEGEMRDWTLPWTNKHFSLFSTAYDSVCLFFRCIARVEASIDFKTERIFNYCCTWNLD